MLKNLFASRSTRQNRARRKWTVRPTFEILEGRELLAGDALQMHDTVVNSQTDQAAHVGDAEIHEVANTRAVLGIATPISPGSTISDTTPTFRWTAANNATWYRLFVYHRDSKRVVIDKWLQGHNNTSHTPRGALGEGNYGFWVQSYGNGRYGAWSLEKSFTIEVPRPGPAQPTAPSGTISDTTPTFRWTAANNATWYRLFVYHRDNKRVVIDKWLQGHDNTSYTSRSALAEGSYSFWVRTWGNGKYGDWSTPMDFAIQTPKPDPATLLGPSGTTSDTTPTFRWNQANNATWYRLFVYHRNNKQAVIDKWLQGHDNTSHTPASALAKGNYSFWVQTWGNGKYGDWSKPMNFTIEAESQHYRLLGAPSLTKPATDRTKNPDSFKLRDDGRGGELVVQIRHNAGRETYRFLWEFDRDIRILRPGDEFKVTVSAERTQGNLPNSAYSSVVANTNAGNAIGGLLGTTKEVWANPKEGQFGRDTATFTVREDTHGVIRTLDISFLAYSDTGIWEEGLNSRLTYKFEYVTP